MLSYDMGERGNASRYDYLYRCIRHDIAHGNILPDEKLPSKRALARNLGVSVITVEAAYAQLIAEGYVRAEERRGYFACELSPVARGGRQGGARNGGNARTGGVSEVPPDSVVSLPRARRGGMLRLRTPMQPSRPPLPLREGLRPFAFRRIRSATPRSPIPQATR